MGITGERSSQNAWGNDELQSSYCKLSRKLFIKIGKIRITEVRAELFEKLKPIQQKGCRVPISLQNKVAKELDRLTKIDTL